jgi:hypothetical protein
MPGTLTRIHELMLLCEHRPMTCEHLRELEHKILNKGIRETFRGAAWSNNCREWVYFECYIQLDAVRRRFSLADCVHDHAHRGTHDGEERGLVCSLCHDGLMGRYDPVATLPIFDGA